MSHSSNEASSITTQDNKFTNYPIALSVISIVFFMWGFLTCLNNILIPHLKTVFNLNYTQAMLVQFTFFGAYFLMSVPGGKIVSKLGYKKGIITGLIIAAIGTFLFWPAATIANYYFFLLALFILATGITILQVSANPYVTLLGPQKTSSSRLNMAQALNALGTTVAPYLGSILILTGAAYTIPNRIASDPQTIQLISTLENNPTNDIEAIFAKASNENVAYALKNIPPYVYEKLPDSLIQQELQKFPPELIGTTLNNIPTEKKLSLLSHFTAEQIDQIPTGSLVEALESFSSLKLQPIDQENLTQLKQHISDSTNTKIKQYRKEQAKSVQTPYAVLGIILVLLAGFVAIFKLPTSKDDNQNQQKQNYKLSDVFKHPHAVLGAIGIFCYVGAEVALGSFMINYLTLPEIGRMSEQQAAQYVTLFWGGTMVGRIVGSAVMVKSSPSKMLSWCAIINLCLLLTTMFSTGYVAVYSIVAIGLFNSIMFPTIFSLGIAEMGPLTEQASSLLVMAIVGGAVVPFIQGMLSDSIGIQHAFFLTLICYAFILYYGAKGSKPKKVKA